eukprot:838112-Rhodomonas_salina.3
MQDSMNAQPVMNAKGSRQGTLPVSAVAAAVATAAMRYATVSTGHRIADAYDATCGLPRLGYSRADAYDATFRAVRPGADKYDSTFGSCQYWMLQSDRLHGISCQYRTAPWRSISSNGINVPPQMRSIPTDVNT